MITGLKAECYKVADIILREAKRNDCQGLSTTPRADVASLHRLATKLHRLYEAGCNGELTRGQAREERRIEARILFLCHRLGMRVRFNGDPRGAPVQLPCARENANGWSGDCIVIPYGPARDYKSSTYDDGKDNLASAVPVVIAPIHSAVCPCCAGNVIVLSTRDPLVWVCAWCSYSLMGIAVPIRPATYQDPSRLYTCIEVHDEMQVQS